MCLCPALRSRPASMHLACAPLWVASYYVHGGVVPPRKNRKTLTMMEISGFNYAASALAPYASCAPCGNATQCSLPSGCQPLSGGSVYPLGIDYMFHLPLVDFLMCCLLARLSLSSLSFSFVRGLWFGRERLRERGKRKIYRHGPLWLRPRAAV